MQKLKEHMSSRRDRVHLGVLVDREQRQSLAALALVKDRSVSSVTRAAIDAYLERERERPRRAQDAAA